MKSISHIHVIHSFHSRDVCFNTENSIEILIVSSTEHISVKLVFIKVYPSDVVCVCVCACVCVCVCVCERERE